MGGFYSNITLKGPEQAAVAKALHGRAAIVTPKVDGCVVVYDPICDKQDSDAMSELASQLSRELHCPAWAILVHDDSVFWYRLFLSGQLADEYNSCPGYFDSGATEITGPSGGNPNKLCSAFASTQQHEVEAVLRKPNAAQDGGYVFETERHADLVRAMSLSEYAVGVAYASFERGEYPEGLSADQLMKTG
jgi:hypothetical protein